MCYKGYRGIEPIINRNEGLSIQTLLSYVPQTASHNKSHNKILILRSVTLGNSSFYLHINVMNKKVVWLHKSHICLLHFLPECRTECFTNQLDLIHMSIWERAEGKSLEIGGSL